MPKTSHRAASELLRGNILGLNNSKLEVLIRTPGELLLVFHIICDQIGNHAESEDRCTPAFLERFSHLPEISFVATPAEKELVKVFNNDYSGEITKIDELVRIVSGVGVRGNVHEAVDSLSDALAKQPTTRRLFLGIMAVMAGSALGSTAYAGANGYYMNASPGSIVMIGRDFSQLTTAQKIAIKEEIKKSVLTATRERLDGRMDAHSSIQDDLESLHKKTSSNHWDAFTASESALLEELSERAKSYEMHRQGTQKRSWCAAATIVGTLMGAKAAAEDMENGTARCGILMQCNRALEVVDRAFGKERHPLQTLDGQKLQSGNRGR